MVTVISVPSHTGGGASGPDGEGCHRPGILTSGLDGAQGYTPPPVPVCSMHEKMGCVLWRQRSVTWHIPIPTPTSVTEHLVCSLAHR